MVDELLEKVDKVDDMLNFCSIPEASESDPKEAARLYILNDWDSLEFIKDSRVTWK